MESSSLDIAIIGMACRFPKAKNRLAYWKNILGGSDCISIFRDDELEKDLHLRHNPFYIKAAGYLEDYDTFDAEFFGLSDMQAQLMTPEHRISLENAWEAMEDAGYNPAKISCEVGVYAACNPESISHYKMPPDWISASQEIIDASYGWCPDSIAPNILYYLGLTGEAVSLVTLCTGFHTAAHFACQSLLLAQSDMAIASGVVVRVPQKRGYFWEEGSAFSRDGHCRPFDAHGTGAAFSSGVATVVLKPIEKALEDGDNIYAVIKGTAINNNGRTAIKYGSAQPERLARCIAQALASANVGGETIGMLEAFGIGLPMADVIEVSALTRAFQTQRRSFCALSAAKGNIGNAGVASGGAGLIKAAMAIKERILPPNANYTTPNPHINFAESPFYVNTACIAWESEATPRRAGVTSVAGGGYNAHIVIEEAPASVMRSFEDAGPYVVTLSARTEASLQEMQKNLAEHLTIYTDKSIADVAYTLNCGRANFSVRWAVVVHDKAELIAALSGQQEQDFMRSSLKEPGSFHNPAESDVVSLTNKGVVLRALPPTKKTLLVLAEAWVLGHEIDWAQHYANARHCRVPLPTYPFERKSHWLRSGQIY